MLTNLEFLPCRNWVDTHQAHRPAIVERIFDDEHLCGESQLSDNPRGPGGRVSQFGNVERVNVVTDRDSGQPRGFAFVEMTRTDEAQKAIAGLNGADLHGRTLNVNEARPKSVRGGDRGGFGGRRNNGGRGRW